MAAAASQLMIMFSKRQSAQSLNGVTLSTSVAVQSSPVSLFTLLITGLFTPPWTHGTAKHVSDVFRSDRISSVYIVDK